MNTTLSVEEATPYIERLLSYCHELADISETPVGICRTYLSEAHKRCNLRVSDIMIEAGMHTWQDAVGNQWGRLPSKNANAKSLIIGSHLDTVPNAGAYDGILGVMMGIELARWINDHHIDLGVHLDVVGFGDEEGTRFGMTLIGSRALTGHFQEHWLDIKDSNGITLSRAMKLFDLLPEDYPQASLMAEQVMGFWEVHIEQGPVLENEDLSVAVVTAIAGARRAQISFTGNTGHAGTTPMALRQDAGCAAAELTLFVESLAKKHQADCVATVGSLIFSPGAVNVIPGDATLSLDVRSQNDHKRDSLANAILAEAERIASSRQLTLDWQETHEAAAVPCDNAIQSLFASSIKAYSPADGLSVKYLPSGAGHDAMAMAELTPMGMLFIRSPGGISHNPKERVQAKDVIDAFRVMVTALMAYEVTDKPIACA